MRGFIAKHKKCELYAAGRLVSGSLTRYLDKEAHDHGHDTIALRT